MSLTVLTIVKDRTSHLEKLIEGVRSSHVRPDHLVIADMGKVKAEIDVSDLPVRHIHWPASGLPLAAARNLAASHATTDKLVFLDVDCIPSTGLLGLLDEVSNQVTGLICAPVRYLPRGFALHGQWSESSLLAQGVEHPVRRFPKHGYRIEVNRGLFWSLVFAIDRLQFEALGGFDEAYDGYGAEDTDLSFRAGKAGIPLIFAGGACAFHQYHPVIDPPLQHFADIVRNATLFRRRWDVWPMDGWLSAFQALGLIRMSARHIEVLRLPTVIEIADATRKNDAPF